MIDALPLHYSYRHIPSRITPSISFSLTQPDRDGISAADYARTHGFQLVSDLLVRETGQREANAAQYRHGGEQKGFGCQ
jgi:hypothetical protein